MFYKMGSKWIHYNKKSQHVTKSTHVIYSQKSITFVPVLTLKIVFTKKKQSLPPKDAISMTLLWNVIEMGESIQSTEKIDPLQTVK